MLWAANIPDSYLVGVLPVILGGLFGVVAWMVRELARLTRGITDMQVINAAMAERVNAQHEAMIMMAARIRDLERV